MGKMKSNDLNDAYNEALGALIEATNVGDSFAGNGKKWEVVSKEPGKLRLASREYKELVCKSCGNKNQDEFARYPHFGVNSYLCSKCETQVTQEAEPVVHWEITSLVNLPLKREFDRLQGMARLAEIAG